MSENKLSDIVRASLDGVRDFADVKCAVGEPITTPDGVTIIPVSRISVGFATGGLDFGAKRLASAQNFGGGGGTGVSVTPLAFLTVGKNSEINLIQVSDSESSGVDRALSLFERSPEIIKKIKDTLS